MTTSLRRSFALTLLTLLPLVILWGMILYFNPGRRVTEIPQTPPHWIEDSPNYGTCSNAMSGTPTADQPVVINQIRAGRIGAGVIDSQTKLSTLNGATVTDKPVLVRRNFADGQSRLAWLYAEGRITDNVGMEATVEIVYIDAATGEPLLLIKDLHAGDPNFSCSFMVSNFGSLEKFGQSLLLYAVGAVITVIYLIVVFIIRRRNKPKIEAPDAAL